MIKLVKLLLFSLLLSQGALGQELKVEEVLDNYAQRSIKLNDVQSEAKLGLKLVAGFFPYSEKLDGRYYYLNPNKHRLEFDDAPSYFDKAPNMFNWALPSLEKYRAKVKGPYGKDLSKTYEVLFLPKNQDSSTLSISCIFQAQDWRLVRQVTSYKDGGAVQLKFEYMKDSELPVLDRIVAKVSIPSYSLSGDATIQFSEQKVNEGLDASVFTASSKK